MPLKQSAWAKGNQQAKRPQTAGAVHVQRFIYTVFSAADALLANDIVEIGELPPFCRIVDAKLYTNGTMTAVTADVGMLSGEYGDLDNARTVGKELFEAADLTAMARLVKSDALKIDSIEGSRGIGVKVLAAVPAAATKYLVLELSYIQ